MLILLVAVLSLQTWGETTRCATAHSSAQVQMHVAKFVSSILPWFWITSCRVFIWNRFGLSLLCEPQLTLVSRLPWFSTWCRWIFLLVHLLMVFHSIHLPARLDGKFLSYRCVMTLMPLAVLFQPSLPCLELLTRVNFLSLPSIFGLKYFYSVFTQISTRESISKVNLDNSLYQTSINFLILQVQSAFMIDLNQVSFALCNSTAHSLVILDEFGKGTLSTGS